jgi:predicted peptidase
MGSRALAPILLLALPACSAADVGDPADVAGKRADDAMVQTSRLFERTVETPVRLPYLLALPAGYDDPARRDERWPLLLFLHGIGECGTDLELVKRHGPPKLVAQGRKLPCIVVSPQTATPWWSTFVLHALLDELVATLRVDESRLYLTGLSMGGFGAWAAAIERPDRFAALVPICGGGDWVGVRRVKDVPIWIFHGRRDEAVPVRMSEDMVRSLERAGGHPKLTIYDDLAHDSWTRTYDDPALWTWLFAQRRGD